MHVAVCIVGFRNSGDIVECLDALSASSHSDFEIVICENGGRASYEALRDHLPSRLAQGQPVRIIEAPGNLGYAGGVNVCLGAAQGADAWWVLNPDTHPDPNAMSALLERLAAGDCDAVGGVVADAEGVVESYGGNWNPWLAYPRSIGFGASSNAAVDPAAVERRLSYISGASMMIGRRFLATTGPMREDYFLYCEEVEWFLRAEALGLKLGFAPAALVMHKQGTSTGSVHSFKDRPRMPVYLDTRNKVLVTRDRYPARLPVAALAVLALMGLRCAKRGAWKQLGYALAGWWAGIKGERGAPSWVGA